jgi:hypothetical protein
MTAAATPGYAGHPDADLLAKLAGLLAPMRLSVTVAFGSQADAENASGSPRVIFIDQKWQAKSVKRQPGDGKASFDGWRFYSVNLRAPDMSTLYRLWSAVVDKLDEVLSWTGVDVGDAAEIGQKSNGAGTGGFGLVLPVIVKGPVYNEVYGTATAETVTRSTFVAEADGSGVQVIS